MGFAFKILSIINHPFIINLRGSTQDDKNFYLDLELINGGELFVYLRMADHFTVDQACFYICQVIWVIDYSHEKNIIYRNLKPEKLLIQKIGYLKFIGFGFPKIIVKDKTNSLVGTRLTLNAWTNLK